MKSNKNFPNGFDSWIETHFEIVSYITTEISKDKFDSKLVETRHEEQGKCGMYGLAEELTDEFEELNKGREWDGEFFDEIEKFIKEKLY
jgi:hypothetical protein